MCNAIRLNLLMILIFLYNSTTNYVVLAPGPVYGCLTRDVIVLDVSVQGWFRHLNLGAHCGVVQ